MIHNCKNPLSGCSGARKVLHGHLCDAPPGMNRNLLAFVKDAAGGLSAAEQLELLQQYCADHGLKVARLIVCGGDPETSIQEALRSLNDVDGLIVSDLNRLVEHAADRGYDLRAFIHQFFCANSFKRLISVAEGIDTRTPAGQAAALELINQVKDAGACEDCVQISDGR